MVPSLRKLLLLLLISSVALAAPPPTHKATTKAAVTPHAGTTANVSWVAPTTYVGGGPLPPADLGFYTITYTTIGGVSHTLTVNPPALSTVVTVPCGTSAFTMTVTTSATALSPNATSQPTPVVNYTTGTACAPSAPTGFTVN